MRAARNPEELRERAEWWPVREVPEGVRYLTTIIDVQATRFVVGTIGRGCDGERWLVDRQQITLSPSRRDVDGAAQPISPSAYPQDWAALAPLVDASYPLSDGSGRRMRVRLVCCDSGGLAGPQGSTTERAYQFWRVMNRRGYGARFRLLKGDAGAHGAAGVRQTLPETKVTHAHGGGTIPLHRVNTLVLKDALDADLRQPGLIHLPEWIGQEAFDCLCAEVRGPKKWEKTGPNEDWDIFVYESAAAQILEWDAGAWRRQVRIDWSAPPSWAREWDRNPMVFHPDDGAEAKKPQPPQPARAPRRAGYVGSFSR
jgi:phage terminase large subunit GpA-like protein